MSVSSALLKSAHLLARLRAMQPVDPLATLSTAQRSYFKTWWARFQKTHETPEKDGSLYCAFVDFRGWTAFDWLPAPIITEETSEDDAAKIWNDLVQVAKKRGK